MKDVLILALAGNFEMVISVLQARGLSSEVLSEVAVATIVLTYFSRLYSKNTISQVMKFRR